MRAVKCGGRFGGVCDPIIPYTHTFRQEKNGNIGAEFSFQSPRSLIPPFSFSFSPRNDSNFHFKKPQVNKYISFSLSLLGA